MTMASIITEKPKLDGTVEFLPRPSLRVNFAWTVAGNAVNALAQWGVIVLLARLGNATMVGQYALGLAIASPVVLLAGLNLRTVQATDVLGDFDFSDYLALRLLSVTSALAVVLAILGWSGFRAETAVVVLGVTMIKLFESLSDVCYGMQQQRERMDQTAKSMIGRGLAYLVTLGVLLYSGSAMIPAVFALAAVAALGALFYDLRSSGDYPRPRWRISNLRHIAWLAAPLGVIAMLLTVNANLPRYFLMRLGTEREVGLFAALGYVAVAANTVVMALGQSASPRLARYYLSGNRRGLAGLAGKLALLALSLGIAGVLGARAWGGPVLGILYGPEYAAESRLFELLMLVGALGLLTSAMGYVLSSVRCFAPQIPMFLVVSAVTAWGCWSLTPAEGLWGAAQAQLWGLLAQFILSIALLAPILLRASEKREAYASR